MCWEGAHNSVSSHPKAMTGPEYCVILLMHCVCASDCRSLDGRAAKPCRRSSRAAMLLRGTVYAIQYAVARLSSIGRSDFWVSCVLCTHYSRWKVLDLQNKLRYDADLGQIVGLFKCKNCGTSAAVRFK